MDEPILTPDPQRLVVLPVKYPDLYALYKKSIDCFWTPEEIDFSGDLVDWAGLDKNERHFLGLVLAFFACADGLVNENIIGRFADEVQVSEARLFYSSQVFFEGIHSVVYSNIIDTYIRNPIERYKLLHSITEYPCIKVKTDWIQDKISSNASFAERLVAFACVEGIMFSGAFCSIFWMKKQNKLKGLAFANELISRDEALHTEFAVALFKKIVNRPTKEIITDIIKDAVEIEIEFIVEAIPCRMIGMNSVLMSQYIKFVADRLLLQLGCDKLYNVVNPFSFMELISIEKKTNFFEASVSEYALSDKTMSNTIFDLEGVF
jgi:ribonucleoside-diphosphate reductase subunit M2